MIRRAVAKLAHMDADEIAWRAASAGRILFDRARTRCSVPRWSRTDLRPALAPLAALSDVHAALKHQRWDEAQRELSQHFVRGPRRFPISPQSRPALAERIRRDFPDAADHAARRADRILTGHYDLLGYRGLRFNADPTAAIPDWNVDCVHDRRPPQTFWSTVPYLEPAYGDHKIIWELNRHQHWIALGRAFWLTADPRYRARFLAELASWRDANPPLIGVNWASMLELAFRSISWLWAINLFADANGQDPWPWLVDLLVALDRQLTQVERNLSYYFSPNTHLTGEALALYVAGRTLPEFAASERRADLGRRVLLHEIDRQIAADGGHRERSAHYHRYTLDFYALALIVSRNTGDDEAAARFEEAVARLGSAARLLADDRGRLPHVGDDDGGVLTPIVGREPDDIRDSLAIAAALTHRADLAIGTAPEEALWLLGASAIGPSAVSHQPSAISSGALPETGYYISRSRAGDHLVIDGGPHGYRNGGHAHADALSLTLAVRGVPLLIDPGTACYTIDPVVRNRMRSTALHNTLTLDARPQSHPSGPFHWSHVADGRVHRWRTHEGFDYFDGSHDGYRPFEHRRRVLAMHGDLVVVADFVGEAGSHAAAVHWHLDPRWDVTTRARGAAFDHAGTRVGLSIPHGILDSVSGDEHTGLGWCSSAYGRLERATTVRISHDGDAPFWMVSVFDFDPDNAVADVQWAPVWAEAGAMAHAAAIRIIRAASVDHVAFAEPVAVAAASSATWRVGDVETNARMLFYRSTLDGPFSRVALVDGSLARAGGRLDLSLNQTVPVLVSDRTAPLDTHTLTPRMKAPSCAASPVS